MTAEQYRRIEMLLEKAEEITMEHPLLTPQGRMIQQTLRDTLVKVAAEGIRARERESPVSRKPTDTSPPSR